jgi:hypothetical protein
VSVKPLSPPASRSVLHDDLKNASILAGEGLWRVRPQGPVPLAFAYPLHGVLVETAASTKVGIPAHPYLSSRPM